MRQKSWLSATLFVVAAFWALAQRPALGQRDTRRPSNSNRNREASQKPAVLKDAFYEDSNFVVRIRTTYNQTTSITCNAVVMEEQLVLSDVTCIKYQGMANIDARFVQVISGEMGNETVYGVDQIYINKADRDDVGTELALLKLSRPLRVDAQCRMLIRPEKNHPTEPETAVRVIGYTNNYELKENRTKAAKRMLDTKHNKYVCTTPADLYETPGSQLLRGAPLLHMVDCKQYQLVGIFTRLETLAESKKHQDCYVLVSAQMKWYEQVKTLATLAAKNDAGNNGASQTQPPVIMVSVDDS